MAYNSLKLLCHNIECALTAAIQIMQELMFVMIVELFSVIVVQ